MHLRRWRLFRAGSGTLSTTSSRGRPCRTTRGCATTPTGSPTPFLPEPAGPSSARSPSTTSATSLGGGKEKDIFLKKKKREKSYFSLLSPTVLFQVHLLVHHPGHHHRRDRQGLRLPHFLALLRRQTHHKLVHPSNVPGEEYYYI